MFCYCDNNDYMIIFYRSLLTEGV